MTAVEMTNDRCCRKEPFPHDRARVEHLFALYEKLTAPLAPDGEETPQDSARHSMRTITAQFSGGGVLTASFVANCSTDNWTEHGVPGFEVALMRVAGPEGLIRWLRFLATEAGQTVEISDEGHCSPVMR